MNSIIVQVIGSLATIVAAWIAVNKSSRDAQAKLEQAQAVTDCKLDELTREVREHNGFARRVPVLEEQVKVINHRLENLEKGI